MQWLATQTSQSDITEMIRNADPDWGRFIERLASYRSYLEREGYSHLLQDPDRLIYSTVSRHIRSPRRNRWFQLGVVVLSRERERITLAGREMAMCAIASRCTKR